MAAQRAGLVSLRASPDNIGCVWTSHFDLNTLRVEFFNPESKSCGSKISGFIRTGPYCDLVDMVTLLLRPVSQFVQANAPVRIILPFKIKDRPTLCEERSSILEREREKKRSTPRTYKQENC